MRGLNILVISLLCLLSFSIKAQQITNSGTEFWFAFPEMYDNSRAVYWVNITSNDSTSGTVSIPGLGWSSTFSIKAGEVARVNIPSANATIQGSNQKFSKAIKVLANDEVVVFAVTYHAFRHEAALILPNNALGTRYRAMTYKSEIKSSALHESEFCVVSAGDTVVVEITPKGNIAGGRTVNVAYTDTIYPNEVYQAQAASAFDDLTGSLIESKNGKKFSVYSGNVWSTVVCSPNSDPLMEGVFPTNTWGKNYFVIPTPRVNKDYIRILADKDTTRIFRDGLYRQTIHAGQFYEETITTIRHYTADKPVAMAHFLVTGQAGCTQYVNTDPSMIMCNATEQMFLDSITFFAVDTSAIDSHYVHIITRTTDTGTMYLDSNQLSKWTVFTQDWDYSHRTVNVSPGYHRLESTGCGFIAYSMGIGRAVSYGYATGASLVDLENSITYSNFITGTDTICVGDTVHFKSLIRGKPDSFMWFFGDGDTSILQNPTHSYDTAGMYQIKAIVVYPCITDTLLDTLIVPPPPIIDLGPDTALCNRDTLKFKVNTSVFNAIWSTGSTDSFLVVDKPGKYWSLVYNYCGSGTDTVQIDSLYPDTVALGRDTVLCQGDTLKWDISAILGSTYLWSDSSTSPNNHVVGGGTIWAQVSNVCGVLRDTIQVHAEKPPDVDLGSDTVLCDGQRIQLNCYFSRAKYKWSDGTTSPLKTITAPGGKFKVDVENICGKTNDSIEVAFDYPLSPNLGPDSVICIRDTILLDPISNGAQCLWQNSSTDTVLKIHQQGKYWVQMTNVCGVYSDTVDYLEEYVPVLTLPQDTVICNGQTMDLKAHFSNASYQWNTGETTPVKTVTSPGHYSVLIQNICGSAYDDIIVLYDQPLMVDLGRDTLLCDNNGFDIILNYPNNPSYEWNNGNTASRIRVQHAGTYSVKVNNRCGTYFDEIKVVAVFTPEPNLGPDTILCSGDFYMLQSGIDYSNAYGNNYQWSNGRYGPNILVRQQGKYWLYAHNVCGQGSDTVQVDFNPIPYVEIGDSLICPGEEITYDMTAYHGYQFLWNDLSTDHLFQAYNPGEFKVEVSDSVGCRSTKYFKLIRCPIPLWVPKAFSPNSDGLNEVFKAHKDGVEFFSMKVMDRWNKLVFESEDIDIGWDGTLLNNGENHCAQGTYIWRIEFKEADNHQLQIKVGEVTLLR